MPKLKFFYKETCPYCQKVLRVISKYNIEGIEYADILADDNNREELIRVGGSVMVPCLFIDGVAMYESGDIIDFLVNNIAKK